jgi:AraC-like DNA-binding protein
MRSLIRLQYLEEHVACKHYRKSARTGFYLKKYHQGQDFELILKEEFAVFFLIRGEMEEISTGNAAIPVTANEMCSLNRRNRYNFNVLMDSELVILFFDFPKIQCDQFSLQKLEPFVPHFSIDVRVLPMLEPVKSFVENMIFYLSKKMYCLHMHDLKESEWFFILRGFYTKEESAYFLEPVIQNLNSFEFLVRSNLKKVSTVNELASLCNMTQKTFTRKFVKSFNSTPKQWLLQEKARLADKHEDDSVSSAFYFDKHFNSPFE